MPIYPDVRPYKPEQASVFDSPMTQAINTFLRWTGLGNPQDQVLALMNPMDVGESGGVVGAIRNAIKAYHGSPHDFERFSMDKIGSGEGAQAQGHGLYFGSQRETAESYRDLLSAKTGQTGRLYEVAIDATPDMLLDWDKPLNQQSPEVQQRLAPAIEYLKSRNIMPSYAEKLSNGTIKARELYLVLSGEKTLDHAMAIFPQSMRGVRPNKIGAEYLKEIGVPGAKYADGGSWTAMAGQNLATGPALDKDITHNYVIWDDSLIQILKKYGVAVPVIEALRREAQANNGTIQRQRIEQVMQ